MNISTCLKFAALSALLLVGACTTKEQVAATPPPPPPPAAAPAPAPRPPGITPGSVQDFKVNVGDTIHFAYNEYNIEDSDKATLQNWYLGSQYHVDEFATSEGRSLLDSSVQELVTAMAAFSPPALGEMSLSGSYSTLLPVIAATWQASPADVSVNAQTLVAIPGALADAPDVIVDLGVGLDIDPFLEAQAGLGQTSAWPDQNFEMNPTNDATLRTQGAALIDAMATFSASGEAEFAVLTPHVFHAMPVAPNSLAA